MRSIVLIHGVLRGMGREALCEMIAFKDADPVTPQPTYSRWSVLDAPRNLPDGPYTALCDGQIVPVRCEGGLWLAEEPSIALAPQPPSLPSPEIPAPESTQSIPRKPAI